MSLIENYKSQFLITDDKIKTNLTELMKMQKKTHAKELYKM